MFLQSHTLFPFLCTTRQQWLSPLTLMAHKRSLLERNHWRGVVQNNQERQNVNNKKKHKSHSFDGQLCREVHPSSQTQKLPQIQTPKRGPSI